MERKRIEHAGPLLAGLAVAVVIVAAVWTVPSRGEVQRDLVVTGEERGFNWSGEHERLESLAWEHEVTLAGNPEDHGVLVHVPFKTGACRHPEGTEPAYGHINADLHVFVNGESAYRMEFGADQDTKLENGEPGLPCSTHVDGRLGPAGDEETIQMRAFRPGSNTVEVRVGLHLDLLEPGGGVFTVSAGPAEIALFEVDRDGDGVADARQLAPGVHSGLASLLGATVLGATTAVATSRILGARANARRGPRTPEAAQGGQQPKN